MLFKLIAEVREYYQKPNRYYHNWDHIEDCLDKALALDCDIDVLIALLYHDVIYKPGATDNEALSADFFLLHTKGLRFNPGTLIDVHRLIMLTKHNEIPNTTNGRLVVDIDMSILASDPDTYQSYSEAIKKEYREVYPENIYNVGRLSFLTKLLGRDRIFHSGSFNDGIARKNIRGEIAQLEKK